MKMPALFRKKTDVVDSDNAVETKKKSLRLWSLVLSSFVLTAPPSAFSR